MNLSISESRRREKAGSVKEWRHHINYKTAIARIWRTPILRIWGKNANTAFASKVRLSTPLLLSTRLWAVI